MSDKTAWIFLTALAMLGVYFICLLLLEGLYAGRRVPGVTVLRACDPAKLMRQIWRIRRALPENEILVVTPPQAGPLPWQADGVYEVCEQQLACALREHL